MRTAIYPGSFFPWHEGHTDILDKALDTFDKVIIAVGQNPDKLISWTELSERIPDDVVNIRRNVVVTGYQGLLVDFLYDLADPTLCAVVRGLRNGQDLEYERTQQYWNEDLSIKVPTVYFICRRDLVHISSSAIRAVEKFNGHNKKST